jgi:hypothetical protein
MANASMQHAWSLALNPSLAIRNEVRCIQLWHRWLSTHLDDGRICRELTASVQQPVAAYSVVLYTSDIRGAGTDANVYLHLHGQCGDGRQRTLVGGVNAFDRHVCPPCW